MKLYVIAGLVALALILGTLLALNDKQVPDWLPLVVVAGVGALGLGNQWSSKKRNRRVRGA